MSGEFILLLAVSGLMLVVLVIMAALYANYSRRLGRVERAYYAEARKISQRFDEMDRVLDQKYIQFSPATADLTRAAVSYWRMEQILAKLRHEIGMADSKRIERAMSGLKWYLDVNNVEVVDYTGRAKRNCRDAEIVEAHETPGNKYVVATQTVEPAVFFCGRLVQRARIITGDMAQVLQPEAEEEVVTDITGVMAEDIAEDVETKKVEKAEKVAQEHASKAEKTKPAKAAKTDTAEAAKVEATKAAKTEATKATKEAVPKPAKKAKKAKQPALEELKSAKPKRKRSKSKQMESHLVELANAQAEETSKSQGPEAKSAQMQEAKSAQVLGAEPAQEPESKSPKPQPTIMPAQPQPESILPAPEQPKLITSSSI